MWVVLNLNEEDNNKITAHTVRRATAVLMGVVVGLAAGSGNSLQAQTCTTRASGTWNNPTIWSCGFVPNSSSVDVFVYHDVYLNGNFSVRNLFVYDTASILSTLGVSTLSIYGNLTLNGELREWFGLMNVRLLNPTGGTISGTGQADYRVQFRIGGNYTILPGSNLRFLRVNVLLDGVTLTNKGNIEIQSLNQGAPGALFVNDTSATVVFTGAPPAVPLTAFAPNNLVEYRIAANYNIPTPTSATYWHLTLNGTLNQNLQAAITIKGNLTVASGTLITNNFNITLEGNYTNNASITWGTSLLTLAGNNNQTISSLLGAEVIPRVRLSKTAGAVYLNTDLQASTELTMNGGDIYTQGRILTLGTNGTQIGTLTHTAGKIVGCLRRWTNNTLSTYLFPIGTASWLRTMTVLLGTGDPTTPGTLTACFVSAEPGTSGFPLYDAPDSLYNTFSEGYWTLESANGFAFASPYSVRLQPVGFSSYPLNAATRVVVRPSAASPWQVQGTHVPYNGTELGRNALTTLGAHFALADTTPCRAPIIAQVNGKTSPCVNATEWYYVPDSPWTYEWVVAGGTILTGQGTDSVHVRWTSTGRGWWVAVRANNGCGWSAHETLYVDVHPLPPAQIYGAIAVPEGATGEPYWVDSLAGYTYLWSVKGGTLASGQGTSRIAVNWGTPGLGKVKVVGQNACGTSDTTHLQVRIYDVINSVASGSWGTASTWDCSCVPRATDWVRIRAGYTVTLDANRAVGTVEVESGGVLNLNGRTLTVNNHLIVNGSVVNSSLTIGRINVLNSGNLIRGRGSTASTVTISLLDGAKTIDYPADLTVNGTLSVGSGVVVSNYGRITVLGSITGANATSTWVQKDNSLLTVGGNLLATGTLSANAPGNTVVYTGTLNRPIKRPQNDTYWHLQFEGSATYTQSFSMTVKGNWVMRGSAVVDASAGTYNLTLYGDWIDSSSATNSYLHNAGEVRLLGNTQRVLRRARYYNRLVIGSPTTPTLVAQLGNIVVNTGGLTIYGTLSGNGDTIWLRGNWENRGTFIPGTSVVIMDGTTAQTITGKTTFHRLITNNTSAGGISINAGDTITIKGVLELRGGTLRTTTSGGELILRSTRDTTAFILPRGGSLSGAVIAQRYVGVTGAGAGHRYLSVPVGGQTIASWEQYVGTSYCDVGCDQPSWSGWTSFHLYDETVQDSITDPDGYVDGWRAINDVNVVPALGRGYTVYFWSGSLPVTMQLRGTPNLASSYSLPVSYTNYGKPAHDGWNFVGNPYPAPIDWRIATGWSKTNIDNAVYVWDPTLNQYASWVAGVSTNGGSPVIAPHQGFFIKANTTSPALSVNTGAIVDVLNSKFFGMTASVPSHIKLVFGNSSSRDEVALYWDGNATPTFDSQWDAYDVRAPHAYRTPQLALKHGGIYYSIFATSVETTPDTMPLYLRAGNAGAYHLTFTTHNFNGTFCAGILDGSGTPVGVLTTGDTLWLSLTTLQELDGAYRMVLELPAIPIGHREPSCAESADGELTVVVPGAQAGEQVELWLGDSVLVASLPVSASDTIVFTGLSKGAYVVKRHGTGLCGAPLLYRYYLQAPEPLTLAVEQVPPACDGREGLLAAVVQGGTPPYTYLWNGQKGTAQYSVLHSGGVFEVRVVDAHGCERVDTVEVERVVVWSGSVEVPAEAVAGVPISFSISDTAVVESVMWVWDSTVVIFGTGGSIIIADTGWHEVVVRVRTATCTYEFADSVYVRAGAPLQVQVPHLLRGMYVFREGDGSLWLRLADEWVREGAQVSIYTPDGRMLAEQQVHGKGTVRVTEGSVLPAGVLMVKVVGRNRTLVVRVPLTGM